MKTFRHGIAMDKKKEDDGGGGGDDENKAKSDDVSKRIEAMEAHNKELQAKIDKLLNGKSNGKKAKDDSDDTGDDDSDDHDDDDLRKKAEKSRKASDKRSGDSKALEAALKFSLKSEEFLKVNASLLPKEVGDLFKQAEKENYSSAIEKVEAIKSGIIQSFFALQANTDLLTDGQKTILEDYLKLTKTGKQEKAQEIYTTLFEPAFEMLKRVKKAEALGKGYGSATDADDEYKQKLMSGSKKHFLGERKDA